jgi:TPR repeat protein
MGCHYANTKREYEAGLERRCAFCREPASATDEEANKLCMERIKKNCPVAMSQMGRKQYYERDYETAFKYWSKAAELGDADAHYNLSVMYRKEVGGVEKDEKKRIYHLTEAAIGGHPDARHSLGIYEWKSGRFERARKHWIIAVNLGNQDSLSSLKRLYANGHARKEDYAGALRGYQAAVEAAKSAERETAERMIRMSNRD